MLHEFTIRIPFPDVDSYIDQLNAAGIYYLSYEAPFELTVHENGYGYQEKQDELVDLKIYAEENELENIAEQYFQLLEQTVHVRSEEIGYALLEEEEWQQPFEDIELENGWMICNPESSPPDEQVKSGRIIWFDPQGAFGTGLHVTTQDCLNMILSRDFSSQTIADLGTGSGILSIAAAKKQAAQIAAIDIEPVEREINYNAGLNHVSQIGVQQADLIQGDFRLPKDFDWIFINIGGDEAIQIMERHHLTDRFGGRFLISGVVDWNEQKVTGHMEKSGYQLTDRRQSAEWVTMFFEPS